MTTMEETAPKNTDCAENDVPEDPQNKAILRAMKDMDAGNGKNILSASIETFSMADGKNKKGDSLVEVLDDALMLIKGMVEKSSELEIAKAEKKKKKKKKNKEEPFKNKWDFDTCPCKEFGKTLDDVFVAFLKWAVVPKDGKKKNGDDDDDDDGDGEKVYNVTKAFRRLDAYAEWMLETGTDLIEPPLVPSSMKVIDDVWKMKIGYTKSGCLSWWIDFKDLDPKAIKEQPEVESMRLVVWYSHFVMFDENAQKNGIVMIENMAKMGFFALMTLIPPKLSAKMDRLTIGVLPVKFKKIYILECATWVHIIMAIMRPFISKKMRSRIAAIGEKDYDKMADEMGGLEYVMEGFGKCEGTYTDNPLPAIFA